MPDDPSSTTTRFAEIATQAAAVASQTDLTSVLFTTVEAAMELTGARYGALGVIGEHGSLVEFLHAGIDPDTVEQIGSPPRGNGLLGTITRTQVPIRLDDMSAHEDSVGFPDNHPPMSTFLGVPVRVGDAVYGNLYLTEKDGGFTLDDEETMTALAAVAGAAISTARLQQRLRRVAVVEDRERIARDLHDAIIQDLFAVGLGLQAQIPKLENPDAQESIAHTVQKLDEVIASLRRFIFDLRPPVWVNRSLPRELADLLGHLTEPHDIAVEVAMEGDLEHLPNTVVDDAIALVREAVSNALRHSESSLVNVVIERQPDDLVVLVSDEGKGFDPDEHTVGMGIGNIRTRATRAGGQATISSGAGSGTTVKVVLPL
ncbi:MAG: GAF domain-containing sensor histidine kinase [Acidimicrobiia bacterium]|nr:GAF domain-containing sensor histidine kinase [Acidimicrobiia bacterium]